MYPVCSCIAAFPNPCISQPSADPQHPCSPASPSPSSNSSMHSPKKTLSLTTHIPDPVPTPSLVFLHSLIPFLEQGHHPGQTCWFPRHHSSLSSCSAPTQSENFGTGLWRAGGRVAVGAAWVKSSPEKTITLPRIGFLAKVLQSHLSGFAFVYSFSFPWNSSWCLVHFSWVCFVVFGLFCCYCRLQPPESSLPLVNGSLTSSLHAGVGPGKCWILENPHQQGAIRQQQNLLSEGALCHGAARGDSLWMEG